MDCDNFDPEYSRAIAHEQLQANLARKAAEAQARPFRFEDLYGKPEPESWGPVYPKTASAAVTRWRKAGQGRPLTADETRAYGKAVNDWIASLYAVTPRQGLSIKSNCASGQSGEYDARKHRAALTAKLHARVEADRRARTDKQIRAAYGTAMKLKANAARAHAAGLDAVANALVFLAEAA